MRTAAAVLWLVTAALGPVCDPGTAADVRAPAYVRCAHCGDSWVTVKYEWCYPDPYVEMRDSCGRLHWHDAGRQGRTYHCTRCCAEWSVEEWTGSACWCGFEPGDEGGSLLEPCPDISDEWSPEG